jgi:hypothetical protein
MHTSTPAEEVNHTWSNGKPAYNGDYFSVRKQKTLCSPEHVSYEAHGFLPLGSVAAVEEDTKDYFACASDVSTESPDPRTDPESVNPEVVEHFESKSAPRRQFGDYIYTSHLPLRELTHPTGSPIGERDIVPEPEEDSDSQRKLEVKLRGGSGEGPCEGDCKTCDVVCARSAFVSDDAVFDRVEEPPRDVTEEPNLVSVLDSAIETHRKPSYSMTHPPVWDMNPITPLNQMIRCRKYSSQRIDLIRLSRKQQYSQTVCWHKAKTL